MHEKIPQVGWGLHFNNIKAQKCKLEHCTRLRSDNIALCIHMSNTSNNYKNLLDKECINMYKQNYFSKQFSKKTSALMCLLLYFLLL